MPATAQARRELIDMARHYAVVLHVLDRGLHSARVEQEQAAERVAALMGKRYSLPARTRNSPPTETLLACGPAPRNSKPRSEEKPPAQKASAAGV
jgi:hypothetical protein